MRVLLVEDDSLDAEMVNVIMHRDPNGPHHITQAETLAEALDHLEANHFDIVLVDLSLPDATGDEAAKVITASYSSLPVLVLSGNSDPDFATAVIRAGAQDFIVKGDSARELPRAMSYAVERKATETRLKQMASYDPLTNLANRQEFCTQLDKACARADRHGTKVALMMFDLDHFKLINDTHGHHAGDDLLKNVASKLRSGIRAGDTAARLGGDEFAVILEDIPHEKSVNRWTQQMLTSFRQPVTIGNIRHPITASVGGALYPDHGRTVDELLHCADMAMYDVKRNGRGNLALYTSDMNERRERHYELESNLRNAIAQGELIPYFQPKISLVDGSVVGLEALCRWQRPNGELVEPREFLPIARRVGLMSEVGAAMLGAVTDQLKIWKDEGKSNLPVSINADAQEIGSPAFATRFIHKLKEAGVPPRMISVEITETTLVEPSKVCLENLDLLRNAGVRVELDDFGAGHATFNYLRQFPLDSLKLDRSLVTGVADDPQCEIIVRAMIKLCSQLGLDVVAEGIESPAQLHALRKIGCLAGQGFFISRPMPASQLPQWERIVHRTLKLSPLNIHLDDDAPVSDALKRVEKVESPQEDPAKDIEDRYQRRHAAEGTHLRAVSSEVPQRASSGQSA